MKSLVFNISPSLFGIIKNDWIKVSERTFETDTSRVEYLSLHAEFF